MFMRTKTLYGRQSPFHRWQALNHFHYVPDDEGRMEAIADAALNLSRYRWSHSQAHVHEFKIKGEQTPFVDSLTNLLA